MDFFIVFATATKVVNQTITKGEDSDYFVKFRSIFEISKQCWIRINIIYSNWRNLLLNHIHFWKNVIKLISIPWRTLLLFVSWSIHETKKRSLFKRNDWIQRRLYKKRNGEKKYFDFFYWRFHFFVNGSLFVRLLIYLFKKWTVKEKVFKKLISYLVLCKAGFF